MARATYIYVVMDGHEPLAAFTVKHELVSWVRRGHLGQITGIWRIPDNAFPGRSKENITSEIRELALT